MFIASTHDYILVFSEDGRCFWLKVHEIPQAGRAAKGKPIVNLINVTADTKISAMVPVREFRDDQFLLFATKGGTVKKTALSAYSNIRTSGLIAIGLLTILATAISGVVGDPDRLLVFSALEPEIRASQFDLSLYTWETEGALAGVGTPTDLSAHLSTKVR